MIYVLTTGEYSDYHIVSVFSSKEKAQAAIEWSGMTSLECKIEEWELDMPFPEDSRFPWYIRIELSTGNIVDMRKEIRPLYPTEELHKQTKVSDYYSSFKYDWIDVGCWAENEELAKKIATEKRQEILAKHTLSESVT